ncbi:MAG TPA: beta-N-acetylhexosaminidase [Bacteroidales bacterium]|jgi:hexosaminidase|nr:family 20 glycosylhydrolase [Bacteroidales bacterium]HNV66532.1 beta-N-acetylhexosaminidase [Bacteroidales bacterium]HNY58321.1 beta-N-acetylhexosaminidase [Bacteroidales bacterium]HOC05149.1 beta-N-acetylhexosaminidase [Bacteroidales bacterium]HOH15685.1 beta-N-acetylhexosaminidase [Bacteroidales bacterium]
MKKLCLVMLTIGLFSCQSNPTTGPADLTRNTIIPKPVSVTSADGTFILTSRSDIFVAEGSPEEVAVIGNYLAERLNPSTGLGLRVITDGRKPGKGDILLAINEGDTELGEEGYELVITGKVMTLTAVRPAGLFRGIQTIRQLLPPAIESATIQPGPWVIPAGTIRDWPEYGHRGEMLDVARHFFGPEDVKRFIDHLALYKMNVFHLHLSDDQGWRIEIKSWPNLTAHGGKTEVGGGEGGFFTQEEYSDIVKYAEERYITIIPEIDMPGHTNAALSSYPELNSDGKAKEPYTGTKVGFSSLDTRSEITYKFVDDVVREIAALTPGQYFHIGGDESHSTKIDDYIYFVNRVQDIVESHGKSVTGWDEIAHATLKPDVVVQYWARPANAVKGIAQGAKVLMSPCQHAYTDMKYDSTTVLGLSWAAYIEVDDAYNWDPATLVPEIKRENIVGVQAPLWAETISTFDEAEYLIFPRLPGYAEIGWTPAEMRSWDEYRVRLAAHGKRMETLGIGFYRSPLIDWDQPGL